MGYITDKAIDVDDIEDFVFLEYIIKKMESLYQNKKIETLNRNFYKPLAVHPPSTKILAQ